MRLAHVLPWRHAQLETAPGTESIESQIFKVQAELASARSREGQNGNPSKEVDQLVELLATLHLKRRKFRT